MNNFKVGDIVERTYPKFGSKLKDLPLKGDVGVVVEIKPRLLHDDSLPRIRVRYFNGIICNNHPNFLKLLKRAEDNV